MRLSAALLGTLFLLSPLRADFFGSGVFRQAIPGNWTPRASCPHLLADHETQAFLDDLAQGGHAPLDDWWRERGHERYADLVSASKQLWRLADRFPFSLLEDGDLDRAAQLQGEMAVALREHGREWLTGLAAYAVQDVFLRNGVVWGLSIPCDAYAGGSRVYWGHIREMVPHLQFLRLVDCTANMVERMPPEALRGIPAVTLVPTSAQATANAATALRLPSMPDVRYLDLTSFFADFTTVPLDQLRGLAMDEPPPSFFDRVNTRRGADALKNLEEFKVRSCQPPHGLVLRGLLPRMPRLRVLQLPTQVTSVEAASLALPDLEALQVGYGGYDVHFDWSKMKNLRLLRFGLMNRSAQPWQAIVRSLPNLVHLDIDYEDSGFTEASDTWDAKAFSKLRHLGVRALNHAVIHTKWEELTGLRRLVLERAVPLQPGQGIHGRRPSGILELPHLRALALPYLALANEENGGDVEFNPSLRSLDIFSDDGVEVLAWVDRVWPNRLLKSRVVHPRAPRQMQENGGDIESLLQIEELSRRVNH